MLPDGSAPSSRSCESTNGLAQVNPKRRQNLWPNAQEPPKGSDPRRSAFSPSAAALAPGADWASVAPNRGRGEANCADCGEYAATVSFPHGRGSDDNDGRCGSGLTSLSHFRLGGGSRSTYSGVYSPAHGHLRGKLRPAPIVAWNYRWSNERFHPRIPQRKLLGRFAPRDAFAPASSHPVGGILEGKVPIPESCRAE